MSYESFQRCSVNYETHSYKEISTEEFILLYEKNPEGVWNSHVIPPSLGSEGFGKIFVDLNCYKENFKKDFNKDDPKREKVI